MEEMNWRYSTGHLGEQLHLSFLDFIILHLYNHFLHLMIRSYSRSHYSSYSTLDAVIFLIGSAYFCAGQSNIPYIFLCSVIFYLTYPNSSRYTHS